MKKQMIFGLLGLAFIVSLGVADDIVPVAVSPGAENGPAVVRQSCPTFSWTAVSWALTYKVVVFEAGDGETPAYEKMAATASPVLVKEIPGKAFSWTPSADEALLNGGSYVWYVGAMVNAAQGGWSEGRKFIIAESPAWGVVSEPREDGIGAGDPRQIDRDQDLELTAAAKENFNLVDDPMIQDLIDIEGTEGASNTFYGKNAGNTTMTGTLNSFFGNIAGTKNTSGASNTFLGRAAGYSNTSGGFNTFVGRSAGQNNTTAIGNTFIGYAAGFNNVLAKANTFVGFAAGHATTAGAYNTFVGCSAGQENTTASNNTFLGYLAGRYNTASNNTFLGYSAGYATKTGEGNTFIGQAAGTWNQIGNSNVFLGSLAGRMNKGSRNIFIGYNAASWNMDASDTLWIENSDGALPLIYGNFSSNRLRFNGYVGIETGATHMLDVLGGAFCDGYTWDWASSREVKENIEELTSAEALRAFEKLEPVKFNYKANKDEMCLGFIAEDVPDLVAVNDRKSLNPMDMVAMLTKVVQEQQKAITSLQEKILKLEKKSRKET
jgi:hypothetical protein